jgi:hypothetical protein
MEDWRQTIRTFSKQLLFVVTRVQGESITMRPNIIQVYCREMPRNIICTHEGHRGGTERAAHNSMRRGSYTKNKKHILEHIQEPSLEEG